MSLPYYLMSRIVVVILLCLCATAKYPIVYQTPFVTVDSCFRQYHVRALLGIDVKTGSVVGYVLALKVTISIVLVVELETSVYCRSAVEC